MKILLTNDDGVDADGLAVLCRELAEIGEVHVVAPDSDQSGTSHSLTSRRALTAQIGPAIPGSQTVWQVDGTPTDCVAIALQEFWKEESVDWIVSGINRGGNMSFDIMYSGTVGAAREGAFHAIPSMAISCHRKGVNDPFIYESAAHWARRLLVGLNAHRQKIQGEFINVNVPSLPLGVIRGLRWTHPGRWTDGKLYNKISEVKGAPPYVFKRSGFRQSYDVKDGGDCHAIAQNYVSASICALWSVNEPKHETFRTLDF